MNKPFVEVKLEIHEPGGSKTLKDYVDSNGRFVPLGDQVVSMLEKHEKLHYMKNDTETFIPYHAVMEYDVMKEVVPFPDVADDFCDTGETVAERTITLPRASETNMVFREDFIIFFDEMLVYMLNEGIEVKFMGNVVTAIEISAPPAGHQGNAWTVTDTEGTHEIWADFNGDSYIYPTVDGEEVESVSFTVGTDKMFGMLDDDEDYLVRGLYSVGAVITVEDDGITEYKLAYPYANSASFEPLPEDKKLPAVTSDFFYQLGRE